MTRSKAAGDGAQTARAASSAGGKKFVKSFVKSGSGDSWVDSAAGAGSVSVERIGREQQRRAVAYGRSRGQL